jgi:hypothetical protein
MNFSEIEEVPFVGYYKGRSPFNGRLSDFAGTYPTYEMRMSSRYVNYNYILSALKWETLRG